MKKKTILITIASVIILAGGTVGARVGYVSNSTKDYSNVIYPKVAIEDIDLSGKTRDEAAKLLTERYGDEVLKKKISVKGTDKTYTLDYIKLNAKYNIDEAVSEAFAYGKNLNMFEKYKLIKTPVPKTYKLKFSYDSNAVKDLITGMQKDIDKSPVNASITMVSSGKFSVTPDKTGLKLNTEKLEKDILEKINGELTGDIEIKASTDVVQASITADQLSKINTKISSFNTSFAGSNANRVSNIGLATRSINGKLLMPGDSFSFNDVVGKRTAEKGYKEAGVIVNNKLESGIGGGICQVSTTLYNAVMKANINSTERSHHSLPSHYVKPGLDATVDYGNIDYKFKNTLSYPIFIEGYISGNTVNFSVYSDKSLANRTYDLVSEYEDIQPTMKYIDDPNMFEGETKIEQPSSIGYKVKVYRKIYENGKFVGQDLISNETYKKIDGITRRGTKKRQ